MSQTEAPAHTYDFLSEEAQLELIRSALTELERMHFECQLNITINGPRHVTTFDDGTSQALLDRLQMFENKIELLKAQYQGML